MNYFSLLLIILCLGTNASKVYADGGVNSLLSNSLSKEDDTVTIFSAKKIITMDDHNPEATAIAVSKGRIISVGDITEVKHAIGNLPYIEEKSLQHKIVLPGFIDHHLHPILGSLTLAMDVIATEDWALPTKMYPAANSQEEYLARIKQGVNQMEDKEAWYFTWGYHPLWHGTLTCNQLDVISKTRPICVWHRSCHEFYLNSKAIEAIGLTKEATLNKGLMTEQSNYEEGHFWEQGLNLILAKVMPKLATPERLTFGLKQMIAYLHQNGVTAFNEPGAIITPEIWELYLKILGAEETPLFSTFLADGRGIVDKYGLEQAIIETEKEVARSTTGKVSFIPKQIKLLADGAIISQLMQMKDGYTDGHKGEWIMVPEELERRAKLYWDNGYQLHIHVNGDLGLDVVISVIEKRMRENPRADHRTVIVHFANSTEQQIKRLAHLGCIVSSNPYYLVGFADKYSAVGLGPQRADMMVRNQSVFANNMSLSFHSDLPMAPASPLYLAWCAVNRITPSGRVAGQEQSVSVATALRAITIEAAYSWRIEHELGSITPGKIANFTVLEQNPYEVESKQLKDIKVWGTVFEGKLFPVESSTQMSSSLRTKESEMEDLALAGEIRMARAHNAMAKQKPQGVGQMFGVPASPGKYECGSTCNCSGWFSQQLIIATTVNLKNRPKKVD